MRGLAKPMDARQQSVIELGAEVREWMSALTQCPIAKHGRTG
jgi:hypothetical protein